MNLTSETEKWVGNIDITTQNSKTTLDTNSKYVDRNIELNISIPGIVLSNNQQFYITDTINTWNWDIDEDGNITIY